MANKRTPGAAGSGQARTPATDTEIRSSTMLADEKEQRDRRQRDEPEIEVRAVTDTQQNKPFFVRLVDFVMSLLERVEDGTRSLLS